MSVYGIRDALLEAERVIALTGAGVSVPSGIPDFRSKGGIWERYPPEEFGTVDAFRRDPVGWWAFHRALEASFAEVEPNPAHGALVRLERAGCLHAVITQNVDRLHQRAGSTRVLELHGSGERLRCLDCDEVTPRAALAPAAVPRCARCDAVLKPDVVLFGEELPRDVLEEARSLAREADVCLIVGTSAVVYPAAELPELTFAAGGTLCQLDLEATGLTHRGIVRWFVQGPAEVTLPRVADLVEAAEAAAR